MTRVKRLRGTGQIEPVATATGEAYRVRLPGRRGRRLPGVYTCPEHAEDVLAHALERIASRPDQGGLSLGTFGEQEYERRELAGMRSAAKALSRWRAHVVSSPLGGLALRSVTVEDVIAFVDSLATRRLRPGHGHGAHVVTARAGKQISPGTAEAALVAVRVVLGAAADRRLIKVNPAAGVRLPRDVRKRKRTEDPWTYLLPEEQARLVHAEEIPMRERLALMFAIGTGARQDEQWQIELADLNLERGEVTLRHTKNGKPRTVPLLPLAHAAVEEWLPLLANETRANAERARENGEPFKPSGLLWPRVRGTKRTDDPPRWQEWTEAVLPKAQRHDRRHVRWHDLRHTCGTSLMCGWWGERWSKEEVQAMLDHESVTTTERYAHVADDFLGDVAARTNRAWGALTKVSPEVGADQRDFSAPPARLERATFALGKAREGESRRHVASDFGATLGALESLAIDVLTLVADGDKALALVRALDLAKRVVKASRASTLSSPLRAIPGGRS